MTILGKLQHNARVNSERIDQKNFSVMLGINIGRINKELAIARGSLRLFEILIVEVGIGGKHLEARVSSGSSDSLL